MNAHQATVARRLGQFRAYNQLTGLWFVSGFGFTEALESRATVLDHAQLAVVRATWENVGEVNVGLNIG